jgi:hypothetical protein
MPRNESESGESSLYRRGFLKATTSVGVAVLGVSRAAAQAVTGGTTPIASGSQWQPWGWQSHGAVDVADHHGEPTWLVRYDADATEKLRDWISANNNRHEITLLGESNDGESAVMVVASPSRQVGLTWRAPTDDLLSRPYVKSVDLDYVATLPEPVDPKTKTNVDPMQGIPRVSAWVHNLDAIGDGLAYDDDMPEVDMQTVRDVTNASSSDLTLPDTSSVTVAVIDTGVNTANDESIFGGRVLSTSKNVITGETGLDAVEDGNGHGTFVAAEIASQASEPYQGYAASADVLAVKSLDDEGSGKISHIIEAVRYAADEGADVACLSLGSPIYSYELDQAISYAAGGGMVCCIATGNDRYASRWVASPASALDAIAVAAATGEPATDASVGYFANHGPHSGTTDFSGGHTNGAAPDLIAPGCKIQTKVPRTDGVVETEMLTGTSMAAPCVAGGIAVLYADDASLKGDFEATKTRITNGQAMPAAGVTEDGGHGMLDVANAIADTEPENLDETTSTAGARDSAHERLSDSQGGIVGRWFL